MNLARVVILESNQGSNLKSVLKNIIQSAINSQTVSIEEDDQHDEFPVSYSARNIRKLVAG